MLKTLRDIIGQSLGTTPQPDSIERGHALQLATATLLVELVRADYKESLIENKMVFAQLMQRFELSEDEAQLLVTEAEREADQSVTLQGFTRLLHERLSLAEKHAVIEMLWRVALADNHLDKYEDYLVRKLADLLYVSHSDLIRIRNTVMGDG